MKPPSIKEITKQDLYEYLAYTRKEGADSGWKLDQAEMIGSVLCEENIILGLIAKMKRDGPDSMSVLDAFLSTLIFGFPLLVAAGWDGCAYALVEDPSSSSPDTGRPAATRRARPSPR